MNENTKATEPRVYRIHEFRMPRAQEKLDALNRRGLRLGCPPAKMTQVGVEDVPVFEKDCEGRIVEPRRQIGVNRYILVTVNGAAPKFAGWTLAACIENTDGGNIMRKAPDCLVELDPRFRTCASGCEHCNQTRNRKETFVVIHEAGAQKLVGRDCIRDFLGHDSPDNILARAEWSIGLEGCLGEFEDGMDCGGGWTRDTRATIETLLAYAACATRVYGFISGTRAREARDCGKNLESTGQTALRWMTPPRPNMTKEERDERQKPTDVDTARGIAARAFVLDTLGNRTDLSDFENNLLVICRAETVDEKNTGLAAFVVEYHARETEKTLAREREAKAGAASTHYGTPKVRVKGVAVRYLRSIGYESQYGAGFFHFFTTVEGGHILKWSTGTPMDDVQPGTEYRATFTVKAHDDYKGTKQTSITRAVLDTAPAAQGVAA